jgi:hypothetical protein
LIEQFGFNAARKAHGPAPPPLRFPAPTLPTPRGGGGGGGRCRHHGEAAPSFTRFHAASHYTIRRLRAVAFHR